MNNTQTTLKMPASILDGEVCTLNNRGSVCPVIDEVSLDFIKKIKDEGKHPLEIGCAYGMVGIEAFKQGVKNYTILDLDPRHVTIAMDRIQAANPENLKHLTAIVGDLLTADLPDNFYDNILIARVLHFFCPEELSRAVEKLYNITAPGGSVYAITNTAYMKSSKSFVPIYEERKKRGELWPGYVKNWNECMTPEANGTEIGMKDAYFHFLDSDILKRVFSNYNFEILEAKEYPLEYESSFWGLDGRENAYVLARKRK